VFRRVRDEVRTTLAAWLADPRPEETSNITRRKP
jgi:hypothetical protein